MCEQGHPKDWSCVRRGKLDPERKETHDYSGVLYRVLFQVKEEIQITGLSFLGLGHKSPWEQREVAMYVEIGESPINIRSGFGLTPDTLKKIDATEYRAILFKDQSTVVVLPKPATIPPHMWIEIAFEIKGAHTAMLSQTETLALNRTACDSTGFAFLIGAKQLDTIYFKK